MLDKSIQYYDVLMHRKKGINIPEPILPQGFSYVNYMAGDEYDWAEIETPVGEFDTTDDALACFRENYLAYPNEPKHRCIFIINDKNEKVATTTDWWCYTGKRRDPWIHWVAVRPGNQGNGLGKAIVFEAMKRMLEIEGDRDFYLHTQTWSYKAIGIYIKAGFCITSEKGLAGYENNDYENSMNLLKNYIR